MEDTLPQTTYRKSSVLHNASQQAIYNEHRVIVKMVLSPTPVATPQGLQSVASYHFDTAFLHHDEGRLVFRLKCYIAVNPLKPSGSYMRQLL
jgi:hypothetical protein